jgi:hypothetical protein
MPVTFEFLVGPDTIPPVVTMLSPAEAAVGFPPGSPIKARLTDNNQVALSTLSIQVDGVTYVEAGAVQHGAVLAWVVNGENGYDIALTLPSPLPTGYHFTVVGVRDIDSNQGVGQSHFRVGVGARLISVTNPKEGVLVASFNMALLHDAAFFAVENWVVTPTSVGARELVVTSIEAVPSNPSAAVVRFDGGGSSYSLEVFDLTSLDGVELDVGFSLVEFDIVRGTAMPSTVKLLDSVYGPLGVVQAELSRRTIDRLVVGRSVALATEKQLAIKLAAYSGGISSGDKRMGGSKT